MIRPIQIAMVVSALLVATGSAETIQRLKYNHGGLTVDLGVGLWCFPAPVDFDGDGDLDLLVSCTDVPYNGLYLFENPGGEKMPVFKPARRIGAGLTYFSPSYTEAGTRLLTPGKEIVWRPGGGITEIFGIAIKGTFRNYDDRIRANQWKYVDYDGDGVDDIVVGHGYWGDYGWDNAFNAKGEWTRGPLHGNVYVVRNTGTRDKSCYEGIALVQAGGQPVDVYGMPSPNFADFDGDGDLDLLCGEFVDGFTYFQNTGSRTAPEYAAGRRLERNGKPLVMDLCMIVPVAVDWDGDGDVDLVVGQEDGRVALLEHTGELDGGVPVFEQPKFFQQEADEVKFGALVTPVGVDWDGDGDEDIVAGNTAGYVGFIENLGPVKGSTTPKWAAPVLLEAGGQTLRIMAGPNGSIQGPCEAKWGYTTLSAADWDHDGLLDLVVNSIWGKIVWYRNVGSKTAPKLAAAEPVVVQWEGQPPKPAWNWWDPQDNELVTQWRTTPVVVDWDGDGMRDLVMLDHEGYLAWFRRERRGGELVLLPGQRVFEGGHYDRKNARKQNEGPLRLNADAAGRSGRRKLCIADLDGDGIRELLVNSVNVDLFCSAAESAGPPWRFKHVGMLSSRRLAGHTTSPTTVDFDSDGKRELLIGAEDGYLYYLPSPYGPASEFTVGPFTIKGRGFTIATLASDRKAFSNRDYTWLDVPARLSGWRYTQTAGGVTADITVVADRDATIHLATAVSQNGIDLTQWKKVDGLTFRYTDGGRTAMQVFARDVVKDQSVWIPQGNWSGGLLLLPAGEAD